MLPPQGQAVGRGLQVGWLPGLDEDEFLALESRVPASVPPSLKQARGIVFLTLGDRPAARPHGPVTEINLAGIEGGQALDEFFPQGLPIAQDPYGNTWMLDLEPNGGWGPVFFVSHDPPWIVYQADTAEEFLRQAVAGLSEEARELQPSLEGEWEVVDLSHPQPGDAFTWGLYGPDTELRREGRRFMRKRQPEKPKPWWRRLF